MRALPLALAALLLVSPAPALAAADSLVLQPASPDTGPGGTVTVQVLVRIAPEGKAVVPARAADVVVTAKGGGTVAPASDDPGETTWIYGAPAAVAANLDVTLEARVRAYPDAAGSCRIQVRTVAPPKPAPPEEDSDGDIVEGAEAAAADPVGKMVTIEKWRARAVEADDWLEKKIPARGEPLYGSGPFHEFRVRINEPGADSVEVRWWRADRPKKVRVLTEKSGRLAVDRDQDGLLHLKFARNLEKEKGEYVFAFVVKTKDGRTLVENLVVHRARPPKEEREGKGGGK